MDINRKIIAHHNREKAEWERARMIAYYALIPHIDKKKSANITKLIPFPWDEKKSGAGRRPETKEDAEWLDEIDRIIKKRNGKRNN